MAYTAAFPQSGSSSAGIRVISASDIGQATSTGEIPLLVKGGYLWYKGTYQN